MQVQRPRTAKIKITGIVQGVGYRYYALDTASALGVKGYVKNLAGGGVEVVARAGKEDLEIFIEKLRQGPLNSRVDDMSVDYVSDPSAYPDFRINF